MPSLTSTCSLLTGMLTAGWSLDVPMKLLHISNINYNNVMKRDAAKAVTLLLARNINIVVFIFCEGSRGRSWLLLMVNSFSPRPCRRKQHLLNSGEFKKGERGGRKSSIV
jgi:hypothetical protein